MTERKNPFPRDTAENGVFDRLWREYQQATDEMFSSLGVCDAIGHVIRNTVKFDREDAHARLAKLVAEAVKDEREFHVVKGALRRLGLKNDPC